MNRVTMPPLPWEGVLTRHESEVLAPAPKHVRKLILDTFNGKCDQSDLLYMAKALLQMSDEIFELRERMTAMELAFKAGRDKS